MWNNISRAGKECETLECYWEWHHLDAVVGMSNSRLCGCENLSLRWTWWYFDTGQLCETKYSTFSYVFLIAIFSFFIPAWVFLFDHVHSSILFLCILLLIVWYLRTYAWKKIYSVVLSPGVGHICAYSQPGRSRWLFKIKSIIFPLHVFSPPPTHTHSQYTLIHRRTEALI